MPKKINALFSRKNVRQEDLSDPEQATTGGAASGFTSGSGSRSGSKTRTASRSVYGIGSQSSSLD